MVGSMKTPTRTEAGLIPSLTSARFQALRKKMGSHLERIERGHRRRGLSLSRVALSYGELLLEMDGLSEAMREIVIAQAVTRRLVEVHQLGLVRRLVRSVDAASEDLERRRQEHNALYKQSLASDDAALVAHLPELTRLLRAQIERVGVAALGVLGQIALCTTLIDALDREQRAQRRAVIALRERLDGRMRAFEMARNLGGAPSLDVGHLHDQVEIVTGAVARVMEVEARRGREVVDAGSLLRAMEEPTAPMPPGGDDARRLMEALFREGITVEGLQRWLVEVHGQANVMGSLESLRVSGGVSAGPWSVSGVEGAGQGRQGADVEASSLASAVAMVVMLAKARAADELLRLATLLTDEDGLERALEMHVDAVAVLRQALGAEHPNTLRALGDLARCHVRRGKLDEALRSHEAAWEAQRRSLGEDHVDAWESASEVAWVRHLKGETRAAIGLQARVIKWRRVFLGPEHADTMASQDALAQMRWSQGQREGALSLMTELVAWSQRSLGASDEVALARVDRLAGWLREVGEREEALRWLSEAVEVRLRERGEHDADTQEAMERWVRGLKSCGEHERSREVLSRLVSLRAEVFGPRHPSTTLAQWMQRATLRRLGDEEGAEALTEALRWLLPLDPEGLPDMQRRIQRQLKESV